MFWDCARAGPAKPSAPPICSRSKHRRVAGSVAWKASTRSILRDFAAGNPAPLVGPDVERVIVAGPDLAAGRIIRADIACHAAFAFGLEFDAREELRAFRAITGRIDQAK